MNKFLYMVLNHSFACMIKKPVCTLAVTTLTNYGQLPNTITIELIFYCFIRFSDKSLYNKNSSKLGIWSRILNLVASWAKTGIPFPWDILLYICNISIHCWLIELQFLNSWYYDMTQLTIYKFIKHQQSHLCKSVCKGPFTEMFFIWHFMMISNNELKWNSI